MRLSLLRLALVAAASGVIVQGCGTSGVGASDGGDGSSPDVKVGDVGARDAKEHDVAARETGGHDGGRGDSGQDATFADAGQDAGVDTGHDASAADAGHDASVADAGRDGGEHDAGHDAGEHDAGHDASEHDAGHDAGAPDSGVDAHHADAKADTGVDAGFCGSAACTSGLCGESLTAFGGTSTAGWTFNGNAAYDATTNTAVLVDGVNIAEAGTLIYGDPITIDSFTVQFDFLFTGTQGRADGIAFMIETDGATALGAGYGGFGVLGLHGYGVELDIFDSGPCDPGNGNHAGVDLLSACGTNGGILSPLATSNDLYDGTLPDNGVGDIGDGTWRTTTIQLSGGLMSVSVTGDTGTPVSVSNLQGVALTGFTSGTPYYFGFGGGSGSNGLASRAEIRNVAVTFPSARCL